MTRINIGVRPIELENKHLMAEHRELKRIPNVVRKGRYNLKNVPPQFTLGKGHVSFFYDKLGYLKKQERKRLYIHIETNVLYGLLKHM